MQAALHLTASSSSSTFLPLNSYPKKMCLSNRLFNTTKLLPVQNSRPRPVKLRAAAAAVPADAPEVEAGVDYNSMTSSVFPAEACETLGGVSCDAAMYPEVKLKAEPKAGTPRATETVDREYLEYNEPKTVFPAEACDDLGGEFCEPEYQSGVY